VDGEEVVEGVGPCYGAGGEIYHCLAGGRSGGGGHRV